MNIFDTKFGKSFLDSVPCRPGVYQIFDENSQLIYVGMSQNLRRRLGQYRNAKRRKKHRKMKKIIQMACSIEIESCESRFDASQRELELIQIHRPRWNVVGAFYFLYPMVGMRQDSDSQIFFCYTTEPEGLKQFEFFGAFRSRGITGGAFFSLMELLQYVGHRLPKPKKEVPPRYTYVYGFRQVPSSWQELWRKFFKGESNEILENLVLSLLENAKARQQKKEIQEHLDNLQRFWKHEVVALKQACERLNYSFYPVDQKKRDYLFL